MTLYARLVNLLTPHRAAIGTGLLALGFYALGDRVSASHALIAMLVQLGFVSFPDPQAPPM